MKSSSIPVLIALALTSCGGAAPAKSPASSSPASGPAESSEAEACLKEASLPREPRKDAPEHIVVAHVLVRHAALRRPEGATRTRGQACLRAQEAREEILGGADFGEVVSTYSDAGKDTGGSLGKVSKDQLEPTFANAAFSLDVNELSHVVETSRGFHVIVRTE